MTILNLLKIIRGQESSPGGPRTRILLGRETCYLSEINYKRNNLSNKNLEYVSNKNRNKKQTQMK